MNKEEYKMRYNLTCHECFRIYKAFVPLPDKDGIAIVWCTACEIVLARFDQGKNEYSEEYVEDE